MVSEEDIATYEREVIPLEENPKRPHFPYCPMTETTVQQSFTEFASSVSSHTAGRKNLQNRIHGSETDRYGIEAGIKKQFCSGRKNMLQAMDVLTLILCRTSDPCVMADSGDRGHRRSRRTGKHRLGMPQGRPILRRPSAFPADHTGLYTSGPLWN